MVYYFLHERKGDVSALWEMQRVLFTSIILEQRVYMSMGMYRVWMKKAPHLGVFLFYCKLILTNDKLYLRNGVRVLEPIPKKLFTMIHA